MVRVWVEAGRPRIVGVGVDCGDGLGVNICIEGWN